MKTRNRRISLGLALWVGCSFAVACSGAGEGAGTNETPGDGVDAGGAAGDSGASKTGDATTSPAKNDAATSAPLDATTPASSSDSSVGSSDGSPAADGTAPTSDAAQPSPVDASKPLIDATPPGTPEASTPDASKPDASTPIADASASDADASTKPTDGSSPVATGIKAVKTVFLILLENKDWSEIKASASAPYINSLLAKAATCEGYKNTTQSSLHPSEPNYLYLESGEVDPLLASTDAVPGLLNCARGIDHLTKQLNGASITWKSYQQGTTAGTCPLSNSGDYVPRHNPAVYFDDISGTNCSDTKATTCIDHVVPYTQFATDLAAHKLARYNYITPDLCHDMHGGGSNGCGADLASQIKDGDDWLKAELPAILASNEYLDNGLVLITWDEGAGTAIIDPKNNPIGMIALSPLASVGSHDCTGLSHVSTLRTLQDIFFTQPNYLKGVQGATNLAVLFK